MIKIFGPKENNFNSNGIVVIHPFKLIETKKISLNGWFIDVDASLEYEEHLKQDMLCVVKVKSKLKPQAFRIKDVKKNQRMISFQAEHVMFDTRDYFLVDARPTNMSAIGALNYVNERTDNKSPFNFTSDVNSSSTAYFIRKNLLEALTVIEERWGGYFEADNWNISLKKNVGHDRDMVVSYGKNLESIQVTEDWSNVVTRLYPVGFDGLTIPGNYIESKVKYDKPYTKTVHFETEYEDEDRTNDKLLPELIENAHKYIEKNQYPMVNYEVKSNINDFMEIGDLIHVKHPLVDIQTRVQEYTYNIVSKRVESLVFGNYSRDVKKKFESIRNDLETLKGNKSVLEAIIGNQTDLINNLNKNGHVVIDDNQILILDKLPKENAKYVWRWNMGGLAFSEKGVEGPFKQAWTIDGVFNTDFISAGSITTNHLSSDVGSALDISSNESVNILIEDKVVEKVSEIEIPPGPSGQDAVQWTIGTDGYWYADDVKTDKKAIGEDGRDAEIWTIGANGNWFKNGVDTGQPSKGPKGDKGEQGIQGPAGANGTSQYVYIRYSEHSNGSDFVPSPTSSTKYIGIANTTSSTAPTSAGSYTWSKYSGDDGDQGPQGIPGEKGENGQPTYTWVKYADTPTSGMDDYAEGKKYIGLAFNKTTQTESTNYGDYQWSLMPQNIEIGAKTQEELENITHIYFDNNGYIEFPDEVKSLIQGKLEATIEFWNKKDSLAYGLIQLSGYANSNGNLYPYKDYTTVYLDVFRTNRIGPITMPKPVNRWHHFAITTHPTEGWKLYQDGVEVYKGNAQSTVDVSYLEFRVGQNSGNRWSKAGYRDIRLWDKARSQQEIMTNMYQDLTGSESNLVGYWPVDERNGDIVIDKVNGNNGTIVNGVWQGVQNEITRVETETTAKITTNTDAITLEKSERETQYGTLSDTVSEQGSSITLLNDQVNAEVAQRLTNAEGTLETINESISTVESTQQTFTDRITNLEGDMVEQQTFFRTGIDGLTIGGTDWKTVMHADGEKISFKSQTGNVEAQFGAGGMYVNRWETDFHTIEKFEEGAVKGTIFKNRRSGN